MMASVPRDNRERMPLQACATSSGIAGRLITLPSRKTGTPARGSAKAAAFDARICKGKVIWLKMIAGMGIISISRAQGNKIARNHPQPRKKITSPAITMRSEKRDRNSSAPRTPTTSTARPSAVITNPQPDGRMVASSRLLRFCQRTNKEKAGTKKPCEKFGSLHHCANNRLRIGKYSHPNNPARIINCQGKDRGTGVRVRSETGAACVIGFTAIQGDVIEHKRT